MDSVNRVLPCAPTESADPPVPGSSVRNDVAVLNVETAELAAEPLNETAVPFDVMPTLERASGDSTPMSPPVVNDFR